MASEVYLAFRIFAACHANRLLNLTGVGGTGTVVFGETSFVRIVAFKAKVLTYARNVV